MVSFKQTKKMEEYFNDVLKVTANKTVDDISSDFKPTEDKEFFSRKEVEMEKEKLTAQFQTDVKNLSDASGKIVSLLRDVIAKLELKNKKLEQRVNELEEKLNERTVGKILDDQVIVNLKKEIDDLRANSKLDSISKYRLGFLVSELVMFATSSCTELVSFALAYGFGLKQRFLWS